MLLTPPAVSFETDDDLSIGEFGIATRMVQGAAGAAGAAGAKPRRQATSSRARR